MNRILSLPICAILLLPCAATAQDNAPSAPAASAISNAVSTQQEYVFKFTAKEVENGRVINSREYMLHSQAGPDAPGAAQVKTGSRVPLPVGSFNSTTPPENMQYSYVDVGINFECSHIKMVNGRIAMVVLGDISSYDQTPPKPAIVRQNKWGGSVSIPIGKTETIFSSDDLVSKKTLQVDLEVLPAR